MPSASPIPPKSPTIEPKRPMTTDLPAARADRAQQRVLALTLRSGDREDVVDHEHPDAERDEREDREEQRDEPEAPFDLGLRLLGDLRRRQRLGGVRIESGLDPLDQGIG